MTFKRKLYEGLASQKRIMRSLKWSWCLFLLAALSRLVALETHCAFSISAELFAFSSYMLALIAGTGTFIQAIIGLSQSELPQRQWYILAILAANPAAIGFAISFEWIHLH